MSLKSLNSTIVPLFEKVLSASDAGRIGRLVLPKACAEVYLKDYSLQGFFTFLHFFLFYLLVLLAVEEVQVSSLFFLSSRSHIFIFYDLKRMQAYFPPISQSEGLPLRIQDIKGNEWTFQFRFWPNNNSRMYVLEGVTPCIQSMQLQAGDTGIF